ncbi:MAG TPA: NADH-quinone oxidoreductase subunit L [Gammaproteobacteria bacterium]
MENVYLGIVLAPLLGAAFVGLFCRVIPRAVAHSVAIAGVAIAFLLSLVVLHGVVANNAPVYNDTVYTWAVIGNLTMEVGFLIDGLTALMMVVVTSVSLLVHIYTIGYMHDDPGYNRFFSYISLFTFAMLMLVMSNNFLQLFFGWEAVGLVSYLLIGFWFKRPTAIFANLKAFLVNRVGDFGFLLGIAAVAFYAGSLDYQSVFGQVDAISTQQISIIGGAEWSVVSVICILLFIGAMGKSAQIPLHVWLPDSMEGPTPISALIHAATMVTAGIFMVARMSPLFEYSEAALSFVLIVGALTALLMGLVGIVQNDIKRVVAYSTLSQLGYMTVALGVSAYSAAIFHLMTHAFFKALLFLAAGSVIIAMHHEQDMRKMGGLRKYMPATYWTCLIGALALIGFPGFSGFYSKDMIIEAVHHADIPGAGFAYFCVLAGVAITAFYTFRMLFLTFHGKERFDHHTREHLHESPRVVTVPLILLAIPSVIIGGLTIDALLFGNYFGNAIQVLPQHDVLAEPREHFHGALSFILHGFTGPVLYVAATGVAAAWFIYLKQPELADRLKAALSLPYRILDKKYGFDELYQRVFAGGGRALANRLWRTGDVLLIDGLIVNGAARMVGMCSRALRLVQTGYLYHYAFAMIVGLLVLLGWTVWR